MKGRPVANPEVMLRKEFDGWALLFNPDSAEAVGVNEVGAAVWEMLDGQHDFDAIVRAVRTDFADVPADADEDLRAFLSELEKRGFVAAEVPSAKASHQ